MRNGYRFLTVACLCGLSSVLACMAALQSTRDVVAAAAMGAAACSVAGVIVSVLSARDGHD